MVVAALVHVFTALGAVCGLMATLAFLDHRPEAGFAWLGLALLIDGIDGTFARAARVAERLPRFSGETLDLVVDYVTYVFVPALALLQGGKLGSGAPAILLASVILLSSLYHFTDERSKDTEYRFVGFPAVWNIVAFYVFALALPVWATAALVSVCASLTFVPWSWVHPLRVSDARPLTLAITAAGAIVAALIIWRGFPATPLLGACLVGCGLYGVALSVWWRWRRPVA